jgi:hypothetical protein
LSAANSSDVSKNLQLDCRKIVAGSIKFSINLIKYGDTLYRLGLLFKSQFKT